MVLEVPSRSIWRLDRTTNCQWLAPLPSHLPEVPAWVAADRGYASQALRQRIWNINARPAIPSWRYGRRHCFPHGYLPGMGLQQPHPCRTALDVPQGVACFRYPP